VDQGEPCSAAATSCLAMCRFFTLLIGALLAPVAARFPSCFCTSAACAARSARLPPVLRPSSLLLTLSLLLLLIARIGYSCLLFFHFPRLSFSQFRSLSFHRCHHHLFLYRRCCFALPSRPASSFSSRSPPLFTASCVHSPPHLMPPFPTALAPSLSFHLPNFFSARY